MKKVLFLSALFLGLTTAHSQVYFSENFDSMNISAWTLYDEDGDGYKWETVDLGAGYTPAIASYSYDNATFTALTPNNYIISPAIALDGATHPILKFKVKGQDAAYAAEHYAVYASTTNSVAAMLGNPPLLEETVTDNGPGGVFYTKTIDLSAYKGQHTVYIAFRHFQTTDQFSIHIDDVSVLEAPTTAPNCPTLNSPANGATGIAYLTTALNWTAATTGSTPDNYEVYLDKNPNPTTLVGTVGGNVLTYTASNLDPTSTYYWKVVAKNNVGSSTGCTVFSFTTMDTTYCPAGAGSAAYERISNVTFADINKNSSSTAGYIDYTSVVGNVAQGQLNIPFSATFSGTSYSSDQVLVWIDFNGDKDFDDPGELVMTTTPGKSPWTGNISIPVTANLGNTRMRVRLHDTSLTPNNTPCGNSSYGQVQDFTLNITPALGTSDVKSQKIVSYPNPVKTAYTIEAKSKVKDVKVFDATGKLILSKIYNDTKSVVDFTRFSAGVYVVQVQLEDGSKTTTKVIKE